MALGVVAVIVAAPCATAAPSPTLQHDIRAATFEVVMKKPEHDPLTYEKPLPLELLPFVERTDLYESIGTAFALGGNVYVTAAHVLLAGIDSQFGPPALRSPDGKVYAIGQILKFSAHEDFAQFSLADDPGPTGLQPNRSPRLGDPVLAVGNALGDGIVIRDGLFTSETPEEQDGRWKWIRFSAAASPGNSGGPLLDAEGKVIGIVTRKSPSENLNFALPIARVLDSRALTAAFDQRQLTTLPFLNGTKTYVLRDEFALPLSWPQFVRTYQSVEERHQDEARTQLLAAYADTRFPHGEGSESILFDGDTGSRYGVVTQGSNNQWRLTTPHFTATDLPGDGVVEVGNVAGAVLVHLRRGDRAVDDGSYRDSKAFMDLILKGYDITREVGNDDVRITSLGTALSESIESDDYGRRWQERVWALPFRDEYLIAWALPTPEGYVGLLRIVGADGLREGKIRLGLLAAQVSIPYAGTLAQWQAFLHRSTLLPAALGSVVLTATPTWSLRTPRFQMSVPPSVLPLDAQSRILATMGFMREGTRTIWDITGVWWYRDARDRAFVGLWRQPKPPASAKAELRDRFEDLRTRHSPYNGIAVRDSAESIEASLALDAPGTTTAVASGGVIYCLTLRLDGARSLAQMAHGETLAREAIQILEHGVGEDVAVTTPSSLTSEIDTQIERMRRMVEPASATLGRDVRGRTMSQDSEDYIVAYLNLAFQTDLMASPGNSSTTGQTGVNLETLEEDIAGRGQALQAYWTVAPALVHNRDLWATFLARNRLPSDTPHSPAVRAAEARLADAFTRPPTGTEWANAAQGLLAAYIAERNEAVARVTPAPAFKYLARATGCPAPALTTSKRDVPQLEKTALDLASVYPPQARQEGIEGSVILGLEVSATGCLTGKAVVGSSGSEALDNAALEWIDSAAFLPAERSGKGVAGVTRLRVNFQMSDP